MKDKICMPYLESYKQLYETKFGKKPDFKIEANEFILSISKYFDLDIYINVAVAVYNDFPRDENGHIEKACNKYQILKSFKDELFNIASKVYFVPNFYEEVSLEEKVIARNDIYYASLFKPLTRSVLFN